MLALTGLGGPLGDVTDIPIVGDILSYVSGKATAGAEAAIPQIQAQVKATVVPYLIVSFGIGLVGLAFGVAAYRNTRKAA